MDIYNCNNRFTILLVEDDPGDAELARIAFREGKMLADVHWVSDGVEAFEYLTRSSPAFAQAPSPHLILLDLNMPRMNGREFLAKIKEEPALRHIPVVMLTTSDTRQDMDKCYRDGASGYVVKPVDVNQLISKVVGIERYWITVVNLPEHLAEPEVSGT